MNEEIVVVRVGPGYPEAAPVEIGHMDPFLPGSEKQVEQGRFHARGKPAAMRFDGAEVASHVEEKGRGACFRLRSWADLLLHHEPVELSKARSLERGIGVESGQTGSVEELL